MKIQQSLLLSGGLVVDPESGLKRDDLSDIAQLGLQSVPKPDRHRARWDCGIKTRTIKSGGKAEPARTPTRLLSKDRADL